MRYSYLDSITKKKALSILLINLFCVCIFAALYYIQDYIISYYPDFAELYLLEKIEDEENKDIQKNNNRKKNSLYTLKPLVYYIWFSLITQTTVGYTGIISKENNHETFQSIRSIPFKLLNILQMTSILCIPAFVL